MTKTKKISCADRTIKLLKDFHNKDISALNFQVIVRQLQIKSERNNIIDIENRIISAYQDIATLEFLINKKKHAK